MVEVDTYEQVTTIPDIDREDTNSLLADGDEVGKTERKNPKTKKVTEIKIRINQYIKKDDHGMEYTRKN